MDRVAARKERSVGEKIHSMEARVNNACQQRGLGEFTLSLKKKIILSLQLSWFYRYRKKIGNNSVVILSTVKKPFSIFLKNWKKPAKTLQVSTISLSLYPFLSKSTYVFNKLFAPA